MACSLDLEKSLRNQGFKAIAGIDEAGRGPLAGPVFAAAVILPDNFYLPGLNDSKKLTVAARERLATQIRSSPDVFYCVAYASVEEIDKLNILRATHLAMQRALRGLPITPDHAIIDGLPVDGLGVPHTAVVGGDGKSLSIAAASILAKVARDAEMLSLAKQYPQYAFEKHKGYGTRLHLEKLRQHGPSPVHRKTFAPVAQAARAH